MGEEEKYGQYYWCVKVTPDLSPEGEIYLFADEVNAMPGGTLEFLRLKTAAKGPTQRYPNLILPAGKWLAVYAASVLDGSAVAVTIWKGGQDVREAGS